MALRNIRYQNDEILHKKSKPVKAVNDNIRTLLSDMLETMNANAGLGIAAPQVGVLKRVVVIEYDDILYEMINPEIVTREGEQVVKEACLSIPGKWGRVTRPTYIKVRALNRDGEEYEIEGHERLAVALCHELDHLDGILYTDVALEVHNKGEGDDEYDDEDDEYDDESEGDDKK